MDAVVDLTGRTVAVLGGTSGIGLAVARAAGAAGARVVVASSRRSSVDRALAGLPDGTVGRVVDLTDEAAVAALFDELGAVDHLVFTAGEELAVMELAALDLDRAKKFFDLRFFGALSAARAAAPHLRPGGSITLTTGIAKDRPGKGWVVTAAVCGAVETLTRALAVELAPIRVNAVSPGIVRSPLWGDPDERFFADLAAANPLGRVGEVDDIARAYLFYLGQPYATGSVLTLDGGALLV